MNENNELLESSIQATDLCGELLHKTTLIIWDKAPMANKAVLSCVDVTLRNVCHSHHPFGGKILILVGNFCQTCPVVPRGSKHDVIDTSILSSPLWSLFKIWSLTIPIRTAPDPSFHQLSLDIGSGHTCDITLSTFHSVYSIYDLIDFIFPTDVLHAPQLCSSLSILAPTNRQINAYNTAVLEWLSAPQRTYLAADDIKEVNDENLHPTSLLDYVCRQTPPGIPPHLLTVKIGGIYQLLRNLSVSRNLVKNTRVIITHLGDRLITVRKIGCLNPTTNQQNVDIILPRISFSTTLPSSNYTILRKQFPLAPAYASTFNSCQGLTLDCVGIDLTKPIFSHGQLYTAFSQIW